MSGPESFFNRSVPVAGAARVLLLPTLEGLPKVSKFMLPPLKPLLLQILHGAAGAGMRRAAQDVPVLPHPLPVWL